MSSIKRILIFLTVLTAFYSQTNAQDQDKELSKELMTIAEQAMTETKAIDIARDQMALAADYDTTNLRANYEAGQLFLITINRNNAVKYFLRVFRSDPAYKFDLEYKIAKGYQYGLDFNNAERYFQLYKEKLASKSTYQGKDKVDMTTVDRSLTEVSNGRNYVQNPQNFSIVNIGREINSEYDDYGVAFSEREDEIVFTSRRKDDNLNQNVYDDNLPYEDIFHSKKNGSTWAFATNLGPIVNTLYHESSLAMTANGNTLFIYNDVNGGDILFCDRQADGTWGEPTPLPGIINSSFEEKSISISKDETTLYFTSDRPGGYGKTDIYRATKDSKGEWSNVKNLGPKINTPENEDGPFIDFEGVLYFSSNGKPTGMGGYDIYKAKWDKLELDWEEPVNLGYPINTPDNDVYIVTSADSKRAYYSSVRDEGLGFTDIYIITASEPLRDVKATEERPIAEVKPEPVKPDPIVEQPNQDTVAIVKNDPPKQDPPKQDPPKQDPPKQDPVKTPVKADPPKSIPLKYVVTVVDAETKSPVNAKISLRGQKDNVVVGSTSPGAGRTEFNITNKTAKDYRLSVELDGYVFQNQSVRINGAGTEEKTVSRTVEMRKLSVGVTSVLRNIYFDYDRVRFKTESYTELNKLEAMLRGSNVKVEISGHTDAYGKWDYNKQLSQKRAEAVKDYLTKKGIDPRRIKAVGYGETKPLVSNDDEDEGREINRRVEFKVLQN
jgi:outer membrane protein OmpA-like peptidoglycan-associated protein